MLQKWFGSRKWVATLIAVLLHVFGAKIGIPEIAINGAVGALLVGTGVEGLVDIARVFKRKD